MHLMMLTDCFTILIVNREHAGRTVHNYYIWGPPSNSVFRNVVSGAYSNLFEELNIIIIIISILLLSHILHAATNLRHYIRCLMRL